MQTNRLIYPDICKFIAIFIVTCSHSAQAISGRTWTNFIGGTEIDIAFNMPLFMLMSGWFINLDKLRSTNTFIYLFSKFKRLIIPAISWYFIYCIFTTNTPTITNTLSFYWYLKALFICLGIIIVSAKLIKNDTLCFLLSTIFVILCPYTNILNINFMFPYIWAGYYLRKMIDCNNVGLIKTFSILSLIFGIVLSIYWTPSKSVYMSPFDILEFNMVMLYSYIYRFAIGLFLSVFIIYIIKKFSEKIPNSLASYGQYSLVIYTSSFVINGLLSKILNHFNIDTNEYLILDLLSISTCIIIIALTIQICKMAERNKIAKLLLLGE